MATKSEDPGGDAEEPAPQDDLDVVMVYMREVQRYPRMSGEEEAALAHEILACENEIEELSQTFGLETDCDADECGRDSGSAKREVARATKLVAAERDRLRAARRRLVESNLRLVVHIARELRWARIDVADLIQEGNIALLQAAESYDPRRGVAFGTVAASHIRRALYRFANTRAGIVRVPDHVSTRRRTVRNAERYLTGPDGTAPSWQGVAEYLGLPLPTAIDALAQRKEHVSLDEPISPDGFEGESFVDRLPTGADADPGERFSQTEHDRLVREQLSTLPERERRLLESRTGMLGRAAATLADIGEQMGVTRERARQIQSRALRALRATAQPKRRARGRG